MIGIAADADGGGDADTRGLHLRGGLIAERAGARDDADAALQIDVARHDAEHGLAGADDARAIRADHHRPAVLGIAHQIALHPHHVLRRNAVGDRADQPDAGVGGLHDGVGAESRRHEGDRGGGARRPHRFLHGVEQRAVEMLAAAFAGRDAADDIGAVGDHLLRVEGALVAGHALHQHRRGFVDQNAHDVLLPIKPQAGPGMPPRPSQPLRPEFRR